MSQTKKKKMKQPTPRLRTLVASLMLITAPIIHAENNTEFSSRPLVGVAASFAPHVALALSVEFPTAGAAYVDTNDFQLESNAHKKEYLGYFDNKKCYKYKLPEGYFYPTNVVSADGLCNVGGEKEEFNGNMLNFLTMSAVDIFRSAMTGGNRAFGEGIDAADYLKGDTPTETYLRRARVVSPGKSMHKGDNFDGIFARQNGRNFTKMPYRTISFNENSKEHETILLGLLPHEVIKGLLPDTKFGGNRENEPLNDGRYYDGRFYDSERDKNENNVFVDIQNLRRGPVGQVKKHDFHVYDRGVKIQSTVFTSSSDGARGDGKQFNNREPGHYDRFVDYKIYFYNDKFGFRLGRRAIIADIIPHVEQQRIKHYYLFNDTHAPLGMTARRRNTNGLSYYAEHDYLAIPQSSNFAPFRRQLNVVVKVCDKNMLDSGNLCVPYYDGSGNITHYKPEGLLQETAKKQDIRFAALGYLNISEGEYSYKNPGTQADTSVLRARMKRLIDDPNQEENKYGAEWDKTTGQFKINPDAADARASDVRNSGVINYLNKFGDAGKYKDYDPAAELYYTTLRYLMGNHEMTEDGRVQKGSTPFVHDLSANTEENVLAKDGFPAIYDWEDPYKRDIPEGQQHCHKNSIIFIGDTGTHGEDKVPRIARTALQKLLSYETTAYKDPNMDVGDTLGITRDENNSGPLTGFNYSPADIAGLAYWARTNNMRPDFKAKFGDKWKEEHNIHGSNFMIDVVEENKYKDSTSPWIKDAKEYTNTKLSQKLHNSYYLAAKYGGFNYDPRKAGEGHVKDRPAVSSQWALPSGHAGIVPQFERDGGTPYNYAVANNPKAMKEALESAFKNVVALGNPSQAATGLSIGMGEVLDLRPDGLDYLLQSTYNFSDLVGNVAIYKPIWDSKTHNLKLDDPRFPSFHASDELTNQYHGFGFSNRKVFTIDNHKPVEFTADVFKNITTPSGISKTQFVNYILGDKTLEEQAGTSTLRKRVGLLGTVINSTATPILPAKTIQGCAQDFDSTAKERSPYYAAAANDGMLHIFKTDGKEHMAYMAVSALDKLPEFATEGFQHQYLNDGTPVVRDVCLNDTSQTVLLGTTGRGGKSVYALNVTDISSVGKPSTDNVMWEFSDKDDPDLGLTLSKPVITKGSNGKQYAIVSSGYQTDGKGSNEGYIFILDIGKTVGTEWVINKNYWKVRLGDAGVGAPFVYDGDNDGIGDQIFVGDLAGNVWQLDRDTTSATPFKTPYGTEAKPEPFFKPLIAKPITGAPYAEMVNNKLMVTVGTGRYFSEKDLDTEQTNYAYGLIVDSVGKQPIVETAASSADADDGNILEQKFVADVTAATALDPNELAVYTVTEKKMKDSHKGWRLKLMTGANIVSDSLIRQRQVAHFSFTRSTNDTNISCVRGANVGVVELDITNGGRFPRPLVDTNGDGKVDRSDMVGVGVMELKGVNTSVGTFLNFRNPTTNSITPGVYFNDGNKSGLVILANLGTSAGVRRISWREIF